MEATKYAEYRAAALDESTQIQIQMKIQLEIQLQMKMKIQQVDRCGLGKPQNMRNIGQEWRRVHRAKRDGEVGQNN